MKKKIKFSIADICGCVVLTDPGLYNELKRLFQGYEDDRAPEFTLFIEGKFSDLTYEDEISPVIIESSGSRLDIIESVDRENKKPLGMLLPYKKECYCSLEDGVDYSLFISVIRVCFNYFLEQKGGFLLHAASGIIKGKTCAFSGKSDAGKTTALNNSRPDEIIAEDALAVRIDTKRPMIYSVPFRRDPKASGRADAVFFPCKSVRKPRIVKRGIAESIVEVVANAMFAAPYDEPLVDNAVGHIISFCSMVPAYDLYFGKNDMLREVIV